MGIQNDVLLWEKYCQKCPHINIISSAKEFKKNLGGISKDLMLKHQNTPIWHFIDEAQICKKLVWRKEKKWNGRCDIDLKVDNLDHQI